MNAEGPSNDPDRAALMAEVLPHQAEPGRGRSPFARVIPDPGEPEPDRPEPERRGLLSRMYHREL